ncbi:MAG: PAS domain-containing protein, partial [Acholeplasmataceae bacterium]|nr:PAS domain-containing protein [Acholeplasmataceae bacterium]
PMLVEHMNFFDWVLVDSSSEEVGFFLEKPKQQWKQQPKKEDETVKEPEPVKTGEVPFDAGVLTFEQVNAILNTVPVDMTFVDHEGHVKYFTQGKERIFDRPKTVIGRHVSMCHPPQSVHVVEEILESFKSGEKDHEDFWIQLKDMFVHIRYFAVRSHSGEYLGTLEVSQNIKPIRELTGEKRLRSKD